MTMDSNITQLCESIYELVSEVKSKKNHCRRIGKKVKGLESLVGSLKETQHGHIPTGLNSTLCDLYGTLRVTEDFLIRQRRNGGCSCGMMRASWTGWTRPWRTACRT